MAIFKNHKMLAKSQEENRQTVSENLIECPAYVYPSVKAKLEELHIAVLPNLSELFGNKPGTWAHTLSSDMLIAAILAVT